MMDKVQDVQGVEDEQPQPIPEGYRLRETGSLYSQRQGPFYWRVDDIYVYQALRTSAKHCNSAKIMHGGMITTLADNVMAGAVYRRLKSRAITIQMDISFLSAVKEGDWLEGKSRIRHMTKNMVFCDCELYVGDRLVARANAIFKRPKPQA